MSEVISWSCKLNISLILCKIITEYNYNIFFKIRHAERHVFLHEKVFKQIIFFLNHYRISHQSFNHCKWLLKKHLFLSNAGFGEQPYSFWMQSNKSFQRIKLFTNGYKGSRIKEALTDIHSLC